MKKLRTEFHISPQEEQFTNTFYHFAHSRHSQRTDDLHTPWPGLRMNWRHCVVSDWIKFIIKISDSSIVFPSRACLELVAQCWFPQADVSGWGTTARQSLQAGRGTVFHQLHFKLQTDAVETFGVVGRQFQVAIQSQCWPHRHWNGPWDKLGEEIKNKFPKISFCSYLIFYNLSSMMAESGKIILASCIVNVDDIQVW